MWLIFTPPWSNAGFTYRWRRLEGGETLRAALYIPRRGDKPSPPTLTVDVLPAGEPVTLHAFGIIRTSAEKQRLATDAECLLARELLEPNYLWALVMDPIGPANAPCRYYQAIGMRASAVLGAPPKPRIVV